MGEFAAGHGQVAQQFVGGFADQTAGIKVGQDPVDEVGIGSKSFGLLPFF
jgi:hypothetical protein